MKFIKMLVGFFLKRPAKKTLPYSPTVTMAWDGYPTIVLENGNIFPRFIEMRLNEKYYPNGKVGEWPCDPETGKQLPIDSPKY